MRRVIGLCGFLLFAIQIGQAQNPVTGVKGNHVAAEFQFPRFDGDNEIGNYTLFLSGSFRLSPKLTLRADIPISSSGFVNFDNTEQALGNPYIGIGIKSNDRTSLNFGIRLPLAQDDEFALFTGLLTDQRRTEAFIPDAFTLNAGIRHIYKAPTNLLQIDAGASGDLIFIQEDDGEFFVDYHAMVWLVPPKVKVGAGITGTTFVTGDGDFSENTTNFLNISAKLRGVFQPGLFIRVPIDDQVSEIFDYSIGINFSLALGLL